MKGRLKLYAKPTKLLSAISLAALVFLSTVSAARADCTSPAGGPGAITWNGTNAVIWCDGTSWNSLASGSVGVADGDKGDMTVSVSGATWTIDNSSVSYAKLQNVSAPNKILGRYAAGAGVVQELTVGTGLALDGSGNLTATAGTVTGTGGAGYLSIWDGATDLTRSSTSAGNQLFWDGANHHLGIGTIDPAQPLHIAISQASVAYPLKLDNYNSTAQNGVGVLFSVNGDGAGLYQKTRGKGALIYSNPTGAGWNKGDFHFLQNIASDAANPTLTDSVMTITNGGRVGIGTTSPAYRLDVSGDLLVSGTGSDGPNIRTKNSGNNIWSFDAIGTPNSYFRLITEGGSSGAAERLTVLESGNVGIGATTPGSKLTVAGDVYTSGNALIGSVGPTLFLLDSDHRSAMIHNNGNLLYFLRGSGNGSTSWAQYNSYWPLILNLENNDATFGGNVSAFGYFHNSDARLKENVETLDDGLGIVSKLRGVSYQWKHDHAPALGVIAQEVEKVMPSAVKTNGKGDKTVEYDQLIGPLIEAVKELKADNDALRVRIELLEHAGGVQ